jgi:hypothetical protein
MRHFWDRKNAAPATDDGSVSDIVLPTVSLPEWGSPHAERLEFLGDALLGLGVMHVAALATEWMAVPGEIDRIVQPAVSNAHLAELARSHPIFAGLGLPETGKVAADAVEAVIGVVAARSTVNSAVRLACRLAVPDIAGLGPPDMWLPKSPTAEDLRVSQKYRASQHAAAIGRRPKRVGQYENVIDQPLNDWTVTALLDKGGPVARRRLAHVGNTVVKACAALVLFAKTDDDPHAMTTHRLELLPVGWTGREGVWMSAFWGPGRGQPWMNVPREQRGDEYVRARGVLAREVLGAVALDRGPCCALLAARTMFGLAQGKRRTGRYRDRYDTYSVRMPDATVTVADFEPLEWEPPWATRGC